MNMKSATKLGATALAAMMALSMTACGAASNNAATPNRNGTAYNSGYNYYATGAGRVTDGTNTYRYNGTTNNQSNTRQNTTDLADDAGNAMTGTVNDMKRAAQNIIDGTTDTRGTVNTGTTNNAAANSTYNLTNSGVEKNRNLTGAY